mgnify:CR=1 FL=1
MESCDRSTFRIPALPLPAQCRLTSDQYDTPEYGLRALLSFLECGGMSNTTTTWHSIREASMISGLPESTLRYYEQIGIIDPIARDPSSGHRVYSDKDIESLTTIACLAATGMPLESMREYLKNRFDGPEGARRQIELLDAQSLRLAAKAEACASNRRMCRSNRCTGEPLPTVMRMRPTASWRKTRTHRQRQETAIPQIRGGNP